MLQACRRVGTSHFEAGKACQPTNYRRVSSTVSLPSAHLQHAVACLDAPEVLDEGQHVPDAAAADITVTVQCCARRLHTVLRQAELRLDGIDHTAAACTSRQRL